MSIAKLTNPTRVDWAFGRAAVRQRFGEGDLASILAVTWTPAHPRGAAGPAEDKSLTQGTDGWVALGAAQNTTPPADVHRSNNPHLQPIETAAPPEQRSAHHLEDNR